MLISSQVGLGSQALGHYLTSQWPALPSGHPAYHVLCQCPWHSWCHRSWAFTEKPVYPGKVWLFMQTTDAFYHHALPKATQKLCLPALTQQQLYSSRDFICLPPKSPGYHWKYFSKLKLAHFLMRILKCEKQTKQVSPSSLWRIFRFFKLTILINILRFEPARFLIKVRQKRQWRQEGREGTPWAVKTGFQRQHLVLDHFVRVTELQGGGVISHNSFSYSHEGNGNGFLLEILPVLLWFHWSPALPLVYFWRWVAPEKLSSDSILYFSPHSTAILHKSLKRQILTGPRNIEVVHYNLILYNQMYTL